MRRHVDPLRAESAPTLSDSAGGSSLKQRAAKNLYAAAHLDDREKPKASISSSGPRRPGSAAASRPHFLVCYLCGQQFGSSSLQIHQPQCYVKRLVQWEKSDQLQEIRGPKPIPPEEYEKRRAAGRKNRTKDGHENDDDDEIPQFYSPLQVAEFNEKQYQTFQATALVPCENCGRTFLPDRLVVHKRSCKPGAGSRPVIVRNVSRVQQPVQPGLSNAPVAAATRNAAQSTAVDDDDDEDILDHHEHEDQKVEVVPPGTFESAEQVAAPKPEDAAAAKRSNEFHAFAVDEADRPIHVVTKSSPLALSNSAASSATKSSEAVAIGTSSASSPPQQPQSVVTAPSAPTARNASLQLCQFCQRTFAPDRIAKHESVCLERNKTPAAVSTLVTGRSSGKMRTGLPGDGPSQLAAGGATTTSTKAQPVRVSMSGRKSQTPAEGKPEVAMPSSGPLQRPKFCVECGGALAPEREQRFCGNCGARV